VPSLVCGVWVGFDEKRVIGRGMTGAHAALPAWTELMLGYTHGLQPEPFPSPAGTVDCVVCSETGLLATDQCPNTTTEMFPEAAQPGDLCSLHPGKPIQGVGPPPIDTEAPPPNPAPEARERAGPPPGIP
jgi:penicillin-binding protein 1A